MVTMRTQGQLARPRSLSGRMNISRHDSVLKGKDATIVGNVQKGQGGPTKKVRMVLALKEQV